MIFRYFCTQMTNKTIFKTAFLRYTLILALAAFSALSACAQSPAPVRWRTFVKMVSPTEGEVTVKCLLSGGHHIYGMEMPQGGPRATELNFEGSKGVEFLGAPEPSRQPVTEKDALFDMELSHWDSNVDFVQRFRLAPCDGERTIRVSITYMSCDNTNCTPPRTETFAAKVPAFVEKK